MITEHPYNGEPWEGGRCLTAVRVGEREELCGQVREVHVSMPGYLDGNQPLLDALLLVWQARIHSEDGVIVTEARRVENLGVTCAFERLCSAALIVRQQ